MPPEELASVILEHTHRIRVLVDQIADDVTDLKPRMGTWGHRKCHDTNGI